MKKTILILATLGLCSCGVAVEGSEKKEQPIMNFQDSYGFIRTVEIDSCEYLTYCSSRSVDAGVSIIHKQNCKNHK